MARKWWLAVASVGFALFATGALVGGEPKTKSSTKPLFPGDPVKQEPLTQQEKDLAYLNDITGVDPMRGALKELVDDKSKALKMLAFALPASR